MKSTSWVLATVATVCIFLYILMSRSEHLKTGTISIEELVGTLEKTIEKVEFSSRENEIPEFRYADLKLFVNKKSQIDGEVSVLIFEGASKFSENEAYEISVRLKPMDASVAEYSDELSDLIINSVSEIEKASKDKFNITDVEVKLKIGIKDESSRKVKLSFSDLSFGVFASSTTEKSNSLSIYFRD